MLTSHTATVVALHARSSRKYYRPHRSTTVRSTTTACCSAWSVCLSVWHDPDPFKNGV